MGPINFLSFQIFSFLETFDGNASRQAILAPTICAK